MTKKMIFIFIIWSAVLAGCESDLAEHSATESMEGDNFTFRKGKERFQQALEEKAEGSGVPFSITEVMYVDSPANSLRITTTHALDCDGKFEFIWDGSVLLSSPPQIYMVLRYNGECGSNGQSGSTTLFLDLNEFDLPENTTFHVINGSVTDSSDDKNAASR